jgi:hypothetical protein
MTAATPSNDERVAHWNSQATLNPSPSPQRNPQGSSFAHSNPTQTNPYTGCYPLLSPSRSSSASHFLSAGTTGMMTPASLSDCRALIPSHSAADFPLKSSSRIILETCEGRADSRKTKGWTSFPLTLIQFVSAPNAAPSLPPSATRPPKSLSNPHYSQSRQELLILLAQPNHWHSPLTSPDLSSSKTHRRTPTLSAGIFGTLTPTD